MDDNEKTVPFTEVDVKKYLDDMIVFWLESPDNKKMAEIYIDAFQSVRVSLFGELLPSNEQDDSETQ